MTQIEIDALHAIIHNLPTIAESLEKIANVIENGQIATIQAK